MTKLTPKDLLPFKRHMTDEGDHTLFVYHYPTDLARKQLRRKLPEGFKITKFTDGQATIEYKHTKIV